MTLRCRTPLVLCLALGALCVVGAGAAEAAESSASSALARFQKAWGAASPDQLVRQLDPRGRLRVRVLAPRVVDASWTRAQAARGFATYFGSRGVQSPRLVDVTPKGKGLRTVRLYDYTYRPHGRDVRTTRLTATVKQDAKKRWVLASVIETARPRPRTTAPRSR